MIAATVWKRRPFTSVTALQDAFCKVLLELPFTLKAGLLRVHHELAGINAEEGTLSRFSTKEQDSAGLLSMDASERNKLRALNGSYKEKHGIPFILCVRSIKSAFPVLSSVRSRLDNGTEEEVEAGLREVCKVVRLRLLDIVVVMKDLDDPSQPRHGTAHIKSKL